MELEIGGHVARKMKKEIYYEVFARKNKGQDSENESVNNMK
jgi:hypothetical protein